MTRGSDTVELYSTEVTCYFVCHTQLRTSCGGRLAAAGLVYSRDGSIVSVSSIILAIPILSVSYCIGVFNIGFSIYGYHIRNE